MTILIPCFFGYLLGSVPFGLILTRTAGLGDIRAIGSGNIGATNVLRTGNKKLAAATLFLDGFKGYLAVVIAWRFGGVAPYFVGLAVLLGHLFPVWLGFKGGKGVATGLGVLLAGSFPVGLIACATWLATAFLLRISSAAALIAFAVAPFASVVLGHFRLAALALLIAALVFWKHSANIARLKAGTEPKIGQKT
ncbi:MAG: glycerol-3-phosphate 1-O-acyltransferase PlsY [Acidocella sp.]|nr:glycerol-3-phosphate 1-O-acyltransferase PlsY [Acidocella sp.]